MKIKTSELSGAPLDWMVWSIAGGPAAYPKMVGAAFLRAHAGRSAKYLHPSTDDYQGGQIIDREHISTTWVVSSYPTIAGCWSAHIPGGNGRLLHAPTRLVTAMRCYVQIKLGDEVDVPEELLA